MGKGLYRPDIPGDVFRQMLEKGVFPQEFRTKFLGNGVCVYGGFGCTGMGVAPAILL